MTLKHKTLNQWLDLLLKSEATVMFLSHVNGWEWWSMTVALRPNTGHSQRTSDTWGSCIQPLFQWGRHLHKWLAEWAEAKRTRNFPFPVSWQTSLWDLCCSLATSYSCLGLCLWGERCPDGAMFMEWQLLGLVVVVLPMSCLFWIFPIFWGWLSQLPVIPLSHNIL